MVHKTSMVADGHPVEEDKQHTDDLHVLFFPFLAHGHMIPLYDIARIFAAQNGVRATVVTTPANASVFIEAVEQTQLNDEQDNYLLQVLDQSPRKSNISIEIIPFPSEKVGLPAGVENAEHLKHEYEILKLLDGCQMLREPFEAIIDRLRPSCIVSDLLYAWTMDVADTFRIPRLTFHGSSFFAMSITDVMMRERPHKGVVSDEEEVEIPGLPDKITLRRTQMSPDLSLEDGKSPIMSIMDRAFEAERKSFGIIMNSFYELESKYADYYREVLGKRAWSVGPVSLWHKCTDTSANSRGKKAAIDEHECLKWLDSKPQKSVVYVSFGSISNISSTQLREIAIALEASNQYFVWVVRKPKIKEQHEVKQEVDTDEEDWLPDPKYQERNKGKGLIIRGWAPQVLILDHQATGAFVTHCGWNSTLEGVAAGVPMVTWPVFAEQFLNEKLVTQVLRIGIPVGSTTYSKRMANEVSIGVDAIQKAIASVMSGEEAMELRKRMEQMKEMAWVAVQRGGSSHQGLNNLLNQLRSYSPLGKHENERLLE